MTEKSVGLIKMVAMFTHAVVIALPLIRITGIDEFLKIQRNTFLEAAGGDGVDFGEDKVAKLEEIVRIIHQRVEASEKLLEEKFNGLDFRAWIKEFAQEVEEDDDNDDNKES